MRNAILIFFVGWAGKCGHPPADVVVNPMTGELWAEPGDLLWGSALANRQGMFGRGFAAPWEASVERRPGAESRTEVLVLGADRLGSDKKEEVFGVSPIPVPEPSGAALVSSARRVLRTLELAGEKDLAEELRPYVGKLEADASFSVAEAGAEVKAWKARMAEASRSPLGPEVPAAEWRVSPHEIRSCALGDGPPTL